MSWWPNSFPIHPLPSLTVWICQAWAGESETEGFYDEPN
jgi:hypothetical protein